MDHLIVMTMIIPVVAGHVLSVLLGQQTAAFIEFLMRKLVVRSPLTGFLMERLR